MRRMKKILPTVLFCAFAFVLLLPASALASDPFSEGAFGKFCEEANAAVDRNTDMFRDDLAFVMGALFPTEPFLAACKSSKPTLLANLSSYKNLRGSKESGLEQHVRNYDNMVVKRMEFFIKMAEATGSDFQKEQYAIRRTIELWDKNNPDLRKIVSNRQKSADALKQLKKDYDDLRSRISSPGPQALSSNNTLKNLFTNKTLEWPPKKDQMEGLVLNRIYNLPWFLSSMELESNARKTLETWDGYVSKSLDKLQKRMDLFRAAMVKINEQSKTCASLGSNLQKGIEGDYNSENSLAFGLRQAMLDAAAFDQLLQKHVATELNKTAKDYDGFVKFRDRSEVSAILRTAYSTYTDASGRQDDRMLDAMASYGKAMREYRRMLKDLGRN
ncbi:MAG TPA: hypothetical protein DIC53_05430 [Synergistaceae bacterium]|mgnify:FL=1|nr:hypothetical protein [Synergistaceae bacterium]